MNVFEDLLVELKEENLLEDTVIDGSGVFDSGISTPAATLGNGSANGRFEVASNHENGPSPMAATASPHRPASRSSSLRESLSAYLSSLQLAEHVVSASAAGLNNPGSSFDDLSVKKAEHRYIQACSDRESDEFFEAESALISALESWQADLEARDRQITPAAVRRYAETANPPLSPQALFAMLRFYRGVPPTEASCAKFDAIATRLFSKIVDEERREMLCPRGEIIKHLNQRYTEWGLPVSGPIKTDASDIEMAALSFDDFISEAEGAAGLRELISSKLFDRLREFKHNSGPMVFVPEVAAASIECNLRISRRLIDLVSKESDGHTLENRYPGLDGKLISDALARTIDLGSSPQESASHEAPADARPQYAQSARQHKRERPTPAREYAVKSFAAAPRSTVLGVNRWLLIVTIATLVVSVGIYFMSQYFV